MGPRVLYQKEASSVSNVEVEQNCLQGNCSQPVSPARLGRVRVRRAHTLDLRSSRHCDLCKAYGALYSIIKYRAVCTALYGSFVKYCLYILNPEFNYNRKGSCGIMWNVKRPLQGVNFRSTQLKHETWFTNLLAADQAAREHKTNTKPAFHFPAPASASFSARLSHVECGESHDSRHVETPRRLHAVRRRHVARRPHAARRRHDGSWTPFLGLHFLAGAFPVAFPFTWRFPRA